MKDREIQKIRGNPEDVATVFETMGKSLAWSIRKGLEHGQDLETIVRKFVDRNI